MVQRARIIDPDEEQKKEGVAKGRVVGQPAAQPAPSPEELPLFTRAELLRRGIAPDITQPGEGITRGVMDVGQGLKQLYLMATDPKEAANYTKQVNAEIAEYRDRRGSDPGFDWGRMGGGVLATSPAMLIPGGQATLLPRLAAGGLGGALTAGAEFSPSGTWTEKGAQAGLGLLVGATLPEVASVAARGVVGAGQAAGQAIRPLTSGASNADILSAIQQAGRQVDFTFDIGKIGSDVRKQLLRDARAQLKVSGELDPMALVRKQDFEMLGIQPTRGQLTRDPFDWQRERNLAQIEGIGKPLVDRLSQQPGQLIRSLEGIRPGDRLPAYEAGSQAMDAIGSRFKKSGTYGELGGQIDEIYNRARAAPGADAEMPFDVFKARIDDILVNFEDKIPSPVTKRIAEFQNGDNPRIFSVREAVKLRELINNRLDSAADADVAKSLGALKRQVDEFFVDVAENSGDGAVEAIRLFKEGIKASSDRARAFDAPGLQAAVKEGVAPEDFINKFIMGGKVDDLRALRSALLREDLSMEQRVANLEAWQNIRGQVVQSLIDAASKDGRNFSQAAYRNALEKLGTPTGKGNSKLEILFSPDEIGTLSAVRRVSEAAMADPVTGGVPLVNRSGTGAFMANLMGRVPVLKGLQNSAREAMDAGAVQRALEAIPVAGSTGAAQAALRDAAAAAVGDVATRTVPPMAAPLIQQLREDDRRRRLPSGLLGP